MLQAQSQHVFSHQHQYPQADPSWLQHQQQQQQHQAQHPHQPQHQQQHASLVAQQHAQQVQAAAAAAQQQQQHYGRLAMTGNGVGNPAQGGAGGMGEAGLSNVSVMDGGISEENRKVFIWVAELLDPARREAALMELSKKREQVPELALVIWHSFGKTFFLVRIATSGKANGRQCTGVMTALLQEIISVYPLLNPSQLTAAASNRVCNALALLQCVASHNETRTLFLNGMRPTISDGGEMNTDIFLFLFPSSHPALPLPVSEHDIQVASFRVPPPHLAGRHRCAGEE